MRYYREAAGLCHSSHYTKMSNFAFMEKVRISRFMPTRLMYKEMCLNECTFFEKHHNTRFIISSRKLSFPGQWVNYFRSVPYVYRWSSQEESILPDHYKQQCVAFMKGEPDPVHWRPDTRRFWEDEWSGEKLPVVNAPVPVVYPEDCNEGLWGGEGIVFGYFHHADKKMRKKEAPRPKVLVPEVHKRALYSEILDQWMAVMVTKRALFLIDESFGLDNYILKTDEVNLCSRFGMTLKRKMLQALASPDFCPKDPVRRAKMLKRYDEFIISAEEADWVGLPMPMAVEKAEKELEENTFITPLKDLYVADMVSKFVLREATEAKAKS